MPSLEEEARYLHGCLFRIPLDSTIVERYRAAHDRLFAKEEPSPLVSRVVSRKLDAEAVEFALRWRRMATPLTRKIQILCYLVEVRAAYQDFFVCATGGRGRAALSLAFATLRTAWKFIKGEYLVRRHGLL